MLDFLLLVSLPLVSQQAPSFEDYAWQQSPTSGNWLALTQAQGFWEECQNEAELLDGNLVTIHDSAEDVFIQNAFFTDYCNRSYELGPWIGFTDRSVEGQWEWVSGEPVVYSGWLPGQPNNGLSAPWSDEDYAHYLKDTTGTLGWNDWASSSVAECGGTAQGVMEVSFDPTLDSDGGGVLDAYEDLNHNGIVDLPWETDPNNPADDFLIFRVPQLTAGANPIVIIRQGTPMATFVPLFSLVGAGPTCFSAVSICFNLSQPIRQGASIQLDSQGNANESLAITVPATLIGRSIWIQGYERTLSGIFSSASTTVVQVIQ